MRIREKYSQNPAEFEERGLKVVRPLGSGSFCDAWVVSSTAVEPSPCQKLSTYAVKRATDTERARSEVRILNSLNHLNVTRFVSWFVPASSGTLYMVMEHAKGGDLSDRIRWHQQKDKNIQESVLLEYSVQILLAIKYIHSVGVIHRDIKPKNIFLTPEGVIKMGDFGLATKVEDAPKKERKDVVGRPRSMTLCGSPLYTAPEIVCREKYCAKVDMWGFGVVLFELLTLKLPFQASSRSELFSQICGKQITTDAFGEEYCEGLKELCVNLLHKNPVQRWSAEDALGSGFMQASLPKVASTLRSRIPAVEESKESASSCSSTASFRSRLTSIQSCSSDEDDLINDSPSPTFDGVSWSGSSVPSGSPRDSPRSLVTARSGSSLFSHAD